MTDQYLEPRPEALAHVDHIVVLMLENRSFDNLLGWLYDEQEPPRGQHYEGLHERLYNPFDNVDADGIAFTEAVPVRKNGAPRPRTRRASSKPSPPNFRLPAPDPGEGFRDTNDQLFGSYEVPSLYPPPPLNLGFVNNYARAMRYSSYAFGDAPTDPRDIMIGFTPEQVPVLSELARSFAVCDHWHCSVPSQTLPNRDFVHAASSGGQVNNKPQADCAATTIFNRMQDAIDGGRKDLSWRIYHGTSKGKPFSLTRLIMTALHDPRLDPSFRSIDQFYADAKAGSLPSYAFLEPQFSGRGQNDQHPSADIRPGEQLIARVYEALRDSPQWERTLLVVTYDEHGGCYDHVPPPDGARHPDGKTGAPGQWGFRFDRFGVRVPAVVISPRIEAGTIARPKGYTPFDHTSIIATVTRRFGLDPLTERDRAAPDLSALLTLDAPRTDRPTVSPLPYDPDDEELVNDLHEIAEEALCSLTGDERSEGQSMAEFLHEAYDRYFAGRSGSGG